MIINEKDMIVKISKKPVLKKDQNDLSNPQPIKNPDPDPDPNKDKILKKLRIIFKYSYLFCRLKKKFRFLGRDSVQKLSPSNKPLL